MTLIAFDRITKQTISKVIEYARDNIYVIDDLLDMKNGELAIPGSNTAHLVLVPFARWVCYYIVDHPNLGRCHYFQIKPDATGQLPGKPDMEQIIREFGINSELLDNYITIDRGLEETKIVFPFD